MAFTLQILSASDLEGGVEAISNAPNFAAIVEALEAEAAAGGFASILLSAGDNIISGPFFNAASDTDTFNPVFEGFYNTFALFDTDGDGDLEPLVDVSQIPLETADSDGNGFLDVGEIDAFLLSPANVDGLTAAEVFVTDINGDGFPDFFDEINLVAGGTVDYSIMNVLDFDASALGNHEFDLGSNLLFQAIQFEAEQGNSVSSTGEQSLLDAFPGHVNFLQEVDWPGIQFPYLSANLDFSEQQDLSGISTTELLPASAFASDLTQARDSLTDFIDGTSDQPFNRIAPSTVVNVADPGTGETQQIGVVGATTPLLTTISSPDGVIVNGADGDDEGTSFVQELAPIIQAEIDKLSEAGVNKIVLVSHLQEFEFELELASLLAGIDVIIAGGSDTLIADAEDVERGLQPGDVPDSDNSFDDAGNAIYPVFTQDAAGNPVAVVSTDGEYSYVSRLVIDFDDAGNVVPDSVDAAVSGAFATTAAGVAALSDDPFARGTAADGVQRLVDAVSGVVNAQDGTITGQTAVFLNGQRSDVRTQETNFGVLAGQSLIDAAQQVDDSVFVAVRNGGGIRDQIGFTGQLENGAVLTLPPQENPSAGKDEGDVSQLDIANTLRFNNGVTLLTLTPTQLLEVLEHGVAAANETASNEPGQFPQVAGVRFSFDPTQPALFFDEAVDADGDGIADGLSQGSRVQSVAVQIGIDEDGDPIYAPVVEDGQVVADAPAEIRIATLNFLAGAFGFPGDGYPFLAYTQISDAGAAFQNQVTLSDLPDGTLPAGEESFASPGTEQDALAELLATQFDVSEGDLPFLTPDKGIEEDTLIQNLAFRDDTVLGALPGMDIDGGVASETLTGAGFADDIDAGAGDDMIDGAAGDDVLSGESGNDMVMGGGGDDTITGGSGADTADGGDANDMVMAGSGSDMVSGGGGGDVLMGSSGNDMMDGGSSNDTMLMGSGNDVAVGGDGEDLLQGGSGNDDLSGDAGDDVIEGGSGDDIITGGAGEDLLTGGAGADIFVFGASDGIDTVEDFVQGRDVVDLSGAGVSFADLEITGAFDALITLSDGNTVTLLGVPGDSLTEADFVFG